MNAFLVLDKQYPDISDAPFESECLVDHERSHTGQDNPSFVWVTRLGKDDL